MGPSPTTLALSFSTGVTGVGCLGATLQQEQDGSCIHPMWFIICASTESGYHWTLLYSMRKKPALFGIFNAFDVIYVAPRSVLFSRPKSQPQLTHAAII